MLVGHICYNQMGPFCRAELRASKASAKADKAIQEPPRLGKVRFEAEPVQVIVVLYCILTYAHTGQVLVSTIVCCLEASAWSDAGSDSHRQVERVAAKHLCCSVLDCLSGSFACCQHP